MNKLIPLMSLIFIFGLSACGGEDESSAAAPAPAPAPAETAAAPAPTAEESAGFDLSTVERAEGVVYQDEIYANWPYN